MLKNVEVVVPEFILDEEGAFRTREAYKLAGVERRVERKVTNYISAGVILSYLVAGWGKEGEKNLLVRLFSTQALHQRTPLLKFAERGGVKPNVVRAIYLLAQDTPGVAMATHHLLRLFIAAKRGNIDAKHIKIDGE